MAIWNSRMACPSGSARARSAASSPFAASSASPSRSNSVAASDPVAATALMVLENGTSGPTAIPGEAGRPIRSRGGGIGMILVEIALDELAQGIHRIGRPVAFRPEMQGGVARRLHGHDLDDALGVDPRAGSLLRHLDAAAEALGKLGELDRRAGMQPDGVLHQHRSRCGWRAHLTIDPA